MFGAFLRIKLLTFEFEFPQSMFPSSRLDLARFLAAKNYQVEEAGKLPLRDKAVWKHGIDFAWGTELTVEAIGEDFLAGIEDIFLPSPGEGHFEMVDEDFALLEDMIVGIVVYNRYEVTTSSNAFLKSDYTADNEVDDDKLHAVYGPAGSMAIYCGKISYVGVHHIEYGLNSSNGCSGATVFLLDVPNQHPSVRKVDYGKAVASHAGFHPELGTNIAFILTNPLDTDRPKESKPSEKFLGGVSDQLVASSGNNAVVSGKPGAINYDTAFFRFQQKEATSTTKSVTLLLKKDICQGNNVTDADFDGASALAMVLKRTKESGTGLYKFDDPAVPAKLKAGIAKDCFEDKDGRLFEKEVFKGLTKENLLSFFKDDNCVHFDVFIQDLHQQDDEMDDLFA